MCSSKKEGQYPQWSKNPPWNNGLAPRTSRSVVLQSSYSMVQLFSPTSGSQELIAVVGSAQHKSLACCIAYRARQTELRAAQGTTSPWHNEKVKQSAPTKGAQRAHNSLIKKKREFSSSSHCETGILKLLNGIRFRSVGDPRCHVSLCFCSSSYRLEQSILD